MVGGIGWTEDHLRVRPLRWMGAGLLLAGGTGLAASLFGRPFLTSYFAYVDLPMVGEVPTASALLFDLGVFAVVVGATVLMLIALAHQSVRGRRASRHARRPRPFRPPPGRGWRPPRWGATDGTRGRARHRRADRLRRVAGAAPRTFQVVIGLSLLSYAVNLFIFSMGGLRSGAAPILERGAAGDWPPTPTRCRRRWC